MTPTPRNLRKQDEAMKNFTFLISGMGEEEDRLALNYHCPEL